MYGGLSLMLVAWAIFPGVGVDMTLLGPAACEYDGWCMSVGLENALRRLRRILPLSARQGECSEQVRELHRQILRSFPTKGRILTREEMAQYVSDLDAAVDVLRKNDMVTFSGDGTPVGAYPFTMEARDYQVQVNGHRVHAMCALDSLAVSPMFGMTTHITSHCRVTGTPVDIDQSGKTIDNADTAGAVHVGIAWGAADAESHCADSLCMEMPFLRDGAAARQWLVEDPGGREIFALPEAIEFASRFFVPLVG
ncbi:MAG: alkylmercury lyase family protein [Porticoccaceae bacterium]|nr:alkylmercury lyase family protein [Porticoccaceae bacterium]